MAGGTSGSALQGLTRRFISRGSDKYINGSKIVITDVSASNGTVHAIDKVMLTGNYSLHQQLLRVVVYSKARTNILVAAVVRSGLAPTLSDPIIISRYCRRSVHRSRISNVAAVSAAPATLQTVLLNHAVEGAGKQRH
jgi:hypothetical protein